MGWNSHSRTLALALLAAAPALGQQTVLEEVIVTASKREVRLQDLAMSVGVLTEKDIMNSGAVSLDSWWRMVPSLNVRDGAFGGDTVIIRGLADSDAFQQNQSMNAFYLDDTPITFVEGLFSAVADPSVPDTQRVEVLRGPQGTLFGANAMGGAIRIISNEPDLEEQQVSLEARVSNTEEGDWNYGGHLTWNQPVDGLDSALRVTAFYEDLDGFIDDIGLNRDDINSEERSGVKLGWLWRPSAGFDALLRVHYEDIEVGGYNYADPFGKEEIGLVTRGDYEIALLSPEDREDEFTSASLRLRWDLGWAELYSATTWFDRDTELGLDWSPEFQGEIGFYAPTPFFTDMSQEDWSQEFRLKSNTDGSWDWLLGAFYYDQDTDRYDTGFSEGLGVTLLDATEETTREDIALFGEVNWRFLQDWELTLGGRWYSVDRELDMQGVFFFEFQADNVDGDADDFVPKAALTWHANDDVMAYAQASKGFRPGLFNNGFARSECGAETILEPDELWNYELGTRMAFNGGRQTLNLTVYHMDWEDMQIDFFDPDCPFVYKSNAGKATVDGLELEFSTLLTDSLLVAGGLAYTNAELDEDIPALNAPSGQDIPNVPEWTINLAATWTFTWTRGIGGYLRTDAQFIDSRSTLFDPTTVETFPTETELDSYTLVNLRLGAESGAWRAELFSDNLFDEYAELSCCRYDWEAAVVRPRTTGARFTFDF